MESHIEKTVCNKAEMAGWLVRKVQFLGRVGAPDRMFARAGRVVFIEFKAVGKKLRLNQENAAAELQAAGIEVYWTDKADVALRILGVIH